MTSGTARHHAEESLSPFPWVYRFDRDGQAQDLTVQGPGDSIPEEGFLWVHANLADVRCRDWLARTPLLEAEARAMLLGADEHMRLNGRGDRIWGVLADFGKAIETGEETVFLRIHLGPRSLITTRRHPIQSCATLRRLITTGERFQTPQALFEALVGRILDAMDEATGLLSDQLDEIEDRLLDEHVHDDRRRLAPLRRRIVRLHRIVTGTHRTFVRFDGTSRLEEPDASMMHRLFQRLELPHTDLHALIERARLTQDEVASKLSSETNRQLYILTILGTLLMPPTLISGIFGMNTKGLLFGEDENGFLYAILLCVGSAVLAFLMMAFLRRAPD